MIEKGDLVMVVKPMPCCGAAITIGQVHTATGFYDCCICSSCSALLTEPMVLVNGEHYAAPISILIKIDPPAESDSQVDALIKRIEALA